MVDTDAQLGELPTRVVELPARVAEATQDDTLPTQVVYVDTRGWAALP